MRTEGRRARSGEHPFFSPPPLSGVCRIGRPGKGTEPVLFRAGADLKAARVNRGCEPAGKKREFRAAIRRAIGERTHNADHYATGGGPP